MSIFKREDMSGLPPEGITYPAQTPHAPQIVTDIQYAANSLCQLCHLDMASLCEYVWGEQPPTSRHELADRIAAWADTHRSDRSG